MGYNLITIIILIWLLWMSSASTVRIAAKDYELTATNKG